jgi:hypothetical protein
MMPLLVAASVLAVACRLCGVGGRHPQRGRIESKAPSPFGDTSTSPAHQCQLYVQGETRLPLSRRAALRPRTISIPGITRSARVITPPRDAAGIPGIPPLTSAGKSVFAWDRAQGIRPGDRRGNVLLNAHTWPDGSALGNRLLETLRRGDRIVVRGNGSLLCYRVTQRVEILAVDGMPRYYAKDGRPQLAIVVCSGRRLGPGVWEERTVWFASPSA